jgi:hypothetical protein
MRGFGRQHAARRLTQRLGAHPEQPEGAPGPEEGVRFWYEVDVDNRDPSFKPQTFRLDAEPERDEENATWILVLARQSVQDR